MKMREPCPRNARLLYARYAYKVEQFWLDFGNLLIKFASQRVFIALYPCNEIAFICRC